MNEMIQTMIGRRSIRAYKAEQVRDCDIEQILETGKYAATAMGVQPWHFTVVQSAEVIEAIVDGCRANMRASGSTERADDPGYHTFYHAPTVLIISGQKDAPFAEVDAADATQNMAVAAHALGLGTVYIASFRMAFETDAADALVEALGIPEGYKPIFALSLGYADGEPGERASRKEGTVNWVRQ